MTQVMILGIPETGFQNLLFTMRKFFSSRFTVQFFLYRTQETGSGQRIGQRSNYADASIAIVERQDQINGAAFVDRIVGLLEPVFLKLYSMILGLVAVAPRPYSSSSLG